VTALGYGWGGTKPKTLRPKIGPGRLQVAADPVGLFWIGDFRAMRSSNYSDRSTSSPSGRETGYPLKCLWR